MKNFALRHLPYLALLIAHLIWGGNYVVAKVTLQEFPVMTLGFLRFAFASMLIIPFILTLNNHQQIESTVLKKIKLEHLPLIITSGILMSAANIALFFEGLNRTTAINASVLNLVVPILSVLTGWMFLKEKIYWVNLLGIFIGLAGALSVLGLPLLLVGNFSAQTMLGNVLLILSALSFVAGAIIAKKLLKIYHSTIITATTFFTAAVAFLIPAILDFIQHPEWVAKISVLGILGLFYMAILSSVCAYFLMVWAYERLDFSKATLVQYIEPAIAATLAVPLLGERISFSFIIGTCLIILGVYWGTLGKNHHHHIQHRHHKS